MPKEADMRKYFAIFAILILTACSSNQRSVSAPEQAGASVVQAISSPVSEATNTETVNVPAEEATSTAMPSGYTMAGALSYSNATTVHVAFFINRTDHRPVFGTAYVYFMVDGQEPKDTECQLTFHGGEAWCDLPSGFKKLTVKVTDGTTENESCSMDLPTSVSPDMTKFSVMCAFP